MSPMGALRGAATGLSQQKGQVLASLIKTQKGIQEEWPVVALFKIQVWSSLGFWASSQEGPVSGGKGERRGGRARGWRVGSGSYSALLDKPGAQLLWVEVLGYLAPGMSPGLACARLPTYHDLDSAPGHHPAQGEHPGNRSGEQHKVGDKI